MGKHRKIQTDARTSAKAKAKAAKEKEKAPEVKRKATRKPIKLQKNQYLQSHNYGSLIFDPNASARAMCAQCKKV